MKKHRIVQLVLGDDWKDSDTEAFVVAVHTDDAKSRVHVSIARDTDAVELVLTPLETDVLARLLHDMARNLEDL